MPLLTSFGLSAALTFVLTQLNRVLSKEIFQRWYFKEEEYMPTTNLLLWSNNKFEHSIKEKLRMKIRDHYGIELHNEIDEVNEEISSRKRIVFAVSQIRNNLRDNALLFNHNVEYGFFRNFLGGCVMAILFSILIVAYSYFFPDVVLRNIGITLVIIYSIPILLSRVILKVYGNNYAKILFEQFLSLPKP
ncbi:hypothetical protein [Pedobacter sp.]